MLKPRIENEDLIYGYASFAHRDYSFGDWLIITFSGAIVWFVGLILRIGGTPLKNALIWSLSGLAYRLLREKRRIALINLDLVYQDRMPESRKQDIVKGMFAHFVRMTLDLLFSEIYWPDEKLLARVIQIDTSSIDAAIAQGNGHAMISGHIGNLELMQHVASVRGYPIVTVYKGFRNPWFDLFIGRKRLNRGTGLIEIPSSRHTIKDGKRVKVAQRGIRRIVEEVWGKGHGIAFAADQYARHSRLRMPFLGIPDCPMQAGLMGYVIKNRIPFTLHALMYNPKGEPIWVRSDPIFIEQKGNYQETLRHYMSVMNAWLEARIHEYPEQFYWGHRRFARHYYEVERDISGRQPNARAATDQPE